jgi:hypothetical protein
MSNFPNMTWYKLAGILLSFCRPSRWCNGCRLASSAVDIVYELVSEWLLYNTKWAIFSAISWQDQISFDEIMISALYYANTLSWTFIVLAYWNKSLWVDMSLHSDTLSRFEPTNMTWYKLAGILLSFCRPSRWCNGCRLASSAVDIVFYPRFTIK